MLWHGSWQPEAGEEEAAISSCHMAVASQLPPFCVYVSYILLYAFLLSFSFYGLPAQKKKKKKKERKACALCMQKEKAGEKLRARARTPRWHKNNHWTGLFVYSYMPLSRS